MKLRDLLTNKGDEDDWFSPSALLYDVYGIYLDLKEDQTRIKAYWLDKWLDTDTHVGIRAFYLDDVLVCISPQTGRKNDKYYKFVDAEKKQQLFDYLLTLNEPYEVDEEWLNLEQEV